jgi:hypothetical protein
MNAGTTLKFSHITFIISFLIIFFTGISGLPGSVSGVSDIEVTFDMETEFGFILSTKNIFNGTEAQSYRTEMDIKYGDGNGMVSLSEENSFRAAKKVEVQNLEYTKNTFFDRNSLEVLSTDVEIVNASGLANSTEPLEIIYISEMEATTKDKDSNWHIIIFIGDNYANGIIQLKAPPGWKIQHNPKNLVEFERNNENTFVAGRVNENYDVEMKIYNPAGLDALSKGQNEDDLRNMFEENAVLFFPLVIILIIIGLMVIKRGSRKRENGNLEEKSGNLIEGGVEDEQDDEKK